MGKKVGITVVVVVLIGLICGYYFYLSNKTTNEDNVEITAVSNVLLRKMDTNYPPTPKEVVKYYSDIMKVVYNENYSDEQFAQLADRMLELYDEDLAAINERDYYLLSLKKDVDEYAKNGYTIVSYSTSSSTDVVFDTVGGRECAKMYCSYSIKTGAEYKTSQVVYELRKEKSTGHWKILGFETITE